MVKRILDTFCSRAVRNYITPHLPAARQQPLISKVAQFVACEMIAGDYLEFGVYQGVSFINAYRHLKQQFEERIAQDEGGIMESEAREHRQRIWANMRFFAFDSFQGLPALSAEDSVSCDFQQGQYACSIEDFNENLGRAGIPLERIRVSQGWFSETCTQETREKYDMHKAAVVWIDSDLYSSASTVLSFITPLLQDGTVIIFDDWYSYKGNPAAGEQKAFWEWAQEISGLYSVQEYNKEDWKRCSFIVSKRLHDSN